jgi:hypothetical protein
VPPLRLARDAEAGSSRQRTRAAATSAPIRPATAQARWLFSSHSPSRSQGRWKERQRGRRASQPSSPRESTAAEGDRRPPNAAAGPIARAPPRQRERPPPCARRSRRKRRRTAGVRRLRSASPADRSPGASPWPAPSTAAGRAIDSVRPAPQWRQALASCLTIRSGSATRLSVSPLWPGWPPLVLPDGSRRLVGFRKPSLDGGFELVQLSRPRRRFKSAFSARKAAFSRLSSATRPSTVSIRRSSLSTRLPISAGRSMPILNPNPAPPTPPNHHPAALPPSPCPFALTPSLAVTFFYLNRA